MYISTIPVPEMTAKAVLYGESYVNSAHENSNAKFVLSIYTINQQRASNLATEVGTMLGYPGNIHHSATRYGYFNHYHPGTKYHEPHCFYGFPHI